MVKHDAQKFSFLSRLYLTPHVVFSIFPEFFNSIFLVEMASGRSRETLDTLDSEEEVFAGFTMEAIVQIREECQR